MKENDADDNKIEVSVYMYFIDWTEYCSSKNHPKNDSAVEVKQQQAVTLQKNDIAASTVIVPKAQISPDQSLRELPFGYSRISPKFATRPSGR